MPLHDWSELPEWEGVHQLWISGLYYDIDAKLPPGFRAGLGTVPALTIGASSTKPDVGVHHPPDEQVPATTGESCSGAQFGFEEEVNVLTLDPSVIIHIFRQRDLVAVLELISPSNKDRDTTRVITRDRIIGYLMLGIHVAYVDVQARPAKFSIADSVAQSLEFAQAPLPSPHAMAYRVGPPFDRQGRSLSLSRTSLTIGQPLPTIGLPISREIIVPVDLESTYARAAGFSERAWLKNSNGLSTVAIFCQPTVFPPMSQRPPPR